MDLPNYLRKKRGKLELKKGKKWITWNPYHSNHPILIYIPALGPSWIPGPGHAGAQVGPGPAPDKTALKALGLNRAQAQAWASVWAQAKASPGP